MGKHLAIVMIAMQVLIAGAYAFDHDVRHTIYWLAAAVITASVTL